MEKHGRRRRVLLLHNIIVPYRLALFEELSKSVNLCVFFCRRTRQDRLWDTSLDGYRFCCHILKGITLPLWGGLVMNYTLPLRLLREKYDLYVIGENWRNIFSILTVLLICKLRRKPFIVWSGAIQRSWYGDRNADTLTRGLNRLLTYYRRLLYRNAHSFVAYGERAKDFLVKNGANPEKVHIGTQVVISPGRTHKIKPDKGASGFDGKKVILFLGHLTKRKGVDFLIRAYKGLNRDDALLVVAGSGEEEDHLKSLAGDDRSILFAGYVREQEKPRYFLMADIFVLPTLHDPWAQVINEAMAYGLPIIVTQNDGSSSELIKENGYIVEPGNEDSLRNALERLLDDDEARRRMGQKSRQHIQKYNLDYAVNAFMNAMGMEDFSPGNN